MSIAVLRVASVVALVGLSSGCASGTVDAGDPNEPVTGQDGLDGRDGESLLQLPSQTWTGEVTIDGLWLVPADAELTLDAGALLRFRPGGGLIVEGALISEGTVDDPVRFTLDRTSPDGILGVELSGSEPTSSLAYTSFEGVDLDLIGRPLDALADASFVDARIGIRGRDEPLTLQRILSRQPTRNGTSAIEATDLGTLTLDEVSLSETDTGVLFDGGRAGAELVVTGSALSRVGAAVVAGSERGLRQSVRVTDATISDTAGTALVLNDVDATLEGVRLTDVEGHAIYGGVGSAVVVRDSSFEGLGQDGVRIDGAVELSGVSMLDVQGSFVRTFGADLVATDSTFEVAGYNGLFLAGDATLDRVILRRVVGSAITVDNGDVTATDLTIAEVQGIGAYVDTGELSITRGLVTDTEADALSVEDGRIDLSEVVLKRSNQRGVFIERSPATLADLRIESPRSHGVMAIDSAVVASDLELVSPAGNGIDLTGGSLSAERVSLTDGRFHGIDGFETAVTVSDLSLDGVLEVGLNVNRGDVTLTRGRLTDTGSHGISVKRGDLTLNGVDIQGTFGHGALTTLGDITATDTTVRDTQIHGLYTYVGSMTLTRVAVERLRERGLFLLDGDLVAEGLTVSGARSDAIFVDTGSASLTASTLEDPDGRCLRVLEGDLSFVDSTCSGASSTGLEALDGRATVTDSTVSSVGVHGVRALAVSVADALVEEAGAIGIDVVGEGTSTVRDSVVRGSDNLAIRGPVSDQLALDVSGCDLVDNGNWAIQNAREVSGNHVARNRGRSDVDTGSGGSVDGVFDTTTAQVLRVDALGEPASEPLHDK